MNKKINLTVFCSSKQNLASEYYLETAKTIELLDINKYSIVYGGGTIGIMGTVRETWIKNSGQIISSNIKKFAESSIIDDYLYDKIVDRQKKMVELGDGYLVFPGGYGTHYEMLEVITSNDIGETTKPIFVLNINGIFDNFVNQINLLIKEGFITKDFVKLNIFVESDPYNLVKIINTYNW